MGGGDSYDVFLSYANSDITDAAELNGWLNAQGLSTFFDRSALNPGLRWVPALEDAIDRSRSVAILVGKHGIGNTQQYERELALIRQTRDHNFPVIPVLMPGCDTPPTGFLQLLTWIDFSKGKNVREQPDNLALLRAALSGQSIKASAIRASICPYRGLWPFREEDAAFFCGRDHAIGELVARVREHEFVAVVGPSGSGKSSLVFAGLIPALRQQRRTTTWDVVTLPPGKSPLHNLAEAFGTTPDNAGPAEIFVRLEKEVAALRAGHDEVLARMVDRRLDASPEKPDRLLIYVDQWEELYTMAPGPEDKEGVQKHAVDVDKFIALLVAASVKARASVVITVRADFYNPLVRNPLLSALLPKQQVNIPPMSRNDLRSAIERPARMTGLSFSPPQLVDRILDDVGSEEGVLPLLQFALRETWARREGDKLTAEAYTWAGGVAGAIEKTAQDAYERLTPSQKDAARRLFLRLVTPGDGQADTRARTVIPDDPEQRDIVSLFANPKTRLLVTGYETLHGAPRSTVEVAHEALIHRWGTLRDWVRANRENMRARAAILRARIEWEEHGGSEQFLLDPGVQLERARALLSNPGDVPVDDLRDYLSRSIEKDLKRLDAERETALAVQKRIIDLEKQLQEAKAKAAQARAEEKVRQLREPDSLRPGSKRYYVSYAWADESAPNREEQVDELCEEARRQGLEILRDKDKLVHGDLISDFMRKMGEADRVFIFLSDKYLHSPYCMFELFEMWNNSKQNKRDFLRRVRFFTIGGTRIGKPLDWLAYTKYWGRERDDLRKAIDEVGWKDSGDEVLRLYRHLETFAGKVSDMLALFADVKQARTFEDFLQYGFSDPPRDTPNRLVNE
jgi:energy-coupling factor transporter ATP-binding protein EcfA2